MEELSNKLHNLEIMSSEVGQHIGSNINPDELQKKCTVRKNIGEGDIVVEEKVQNTRIHKQRAHSCSCQISTNSGRITDSFKQSVFTTPNSDGMPLQRTLKVTKHPLKKNGHSINRKFVLREPILKALQTCLHTQSNIPRKLISIKDLNGRDICFNQYFRSHPKEVNFRDLIKECHTMLEESVNYNCANYLDLDRRKPDTNSRKGILFIPSEVNLHDDCSSIYASNIPHGRNAVAHRTSTSCDSPLAVNTGMVDDVTIDELASYFDTLVHIPKKMSAMAEMMYI